MSTTLDLAASDLTRLGHCNNVKGCEAFFPYSLDPASDLVYVGDDCPDCGNPNWGAYGWKTPDGERLTSEEAVEWAEGGGS